MIIGRVGCFFTGIYEETYGLPTTSVFGIHLGDEYLRHPVALYEMFFLIVLWLFLDRIKKKTYFPSGFIFQIFMLSYFTFRLILDFIKPREVIILNLSTIQIVSILIILYYIYKSKQTFKLLKLKE